MRLHKDTHLDHALTAAQLAYILRRFADRAAFFVETFELPVDLDTLPCALYGPLMGDPPVLEADVHHNRRPPRAWTSRVVARVVRKTRTITVIAGPHDGQPCVLFTAYGGPAAPREPNCPDLPVEEFEVSRSFWAEHALAICGP